MKNLKLSIIMSIIVVISSILVTNPNISSIFDILPYVVYFITMMLFTVILLKFIFDSMEFEKPEELSDINDFMKEQTERKYERNKDELRNLSYKLYEEIFPFMKREHNLVVIHRQYIENETVKELLQLDSSFSTTKNYYLINIKGLAYMKIVLETINKQSNFSFGYITSNSDFLLLMLGDIYWNKCNVCGNDNYSQVHYELKMPIDIPRRRPFKTNLCVACLDKVKGTFKEYTQHEGRDGRYYSDEV